MGVKAFLVSLIRLNKTFIHNEKITVISTRDVDYI